MSTTYVTFCSDALLCIKEYRDDIVGDVEVVVKGDVATDMESDVATDVER